MTEKHFVLALGLHNITGSKKVVKLLTNWVHCIDYNLTCEIETSQAEKVQLLASKDTILPLKPITGTALSYFWVDNFDVNVDKSTGGGSVNTTHMMAFQEHSENVVTVKDVVSLERRKKRMIVLADTPIVPAKFDPKKEPTIIIRNNFNNELSNSTTWISVKYLIWLIMRKKNGINRYSEVNNQVIPNFSGKLSF